MLKIDRYLNATIGKIHNRKVSVVSSANSDVQIEIKTVSDDLSPRATHKVIRGKVVSTAIKLSEEGALMLFLVLEDYLKNVHTLTEHEQ